jgi:PEP-CTERM motif-containing protein
MFCLSPIKRNQVRLLLQNAFCIRSFFPALVISFLLVLGTGTTARADPVFLFQFDGTPNGTITPPIVGTGTFSFAIDPGNGTHALTSLGAFSMSFTFGATTFTNADIVTPPGEILVILSTQGTDRRIQFSNILPFGSGDFGGSIDFFNGVEFLTFQPPGTGGNLDLFAEGNHDFVFGNYSGLESTSAIPEPSSFVLLGMGTAGLFGLARKRRSNLLE